MIELLNDFLNHMKNKRKSNNTIKNYKSDLTSFIEYLISYKTDIKNIKEKDIENYLATIECKESSMNRYISAIQSFFKYLRKMQVIEYNPALDLERPKIPEREPIYLQVNESKKLLKSVKGENKERDLAILTIFLHCGLRLSELVDMNVNCITDGALSIIGKGNKQRIVPLDNETIRVITEYLKVRPNIEGENALFLSERNQRISNNTVYKIVKKYLEEAGLDTNKYSTHKLRSTCATLLSKGNVPVQQIQKILGHANINTSMRYVGVDKKELVNAINSNPLNSK